MPWRANMLSNLGIMVEATVVLTISTSGNILKSSVTMLRAYLVPEINYYSSSTTSISADRFGIGAEIIDSRHSHVSKVCYIDVVYLDMPGNFYLPLGHAVNCGKPDFLA